MWIWNLTMCDWMGEEDCETISLALEYYSEHDNNALSPYAFATRSGRIASIDFAKQVQIFTCNQLCDNFAVVDKIHSGQK